MNEYTVTYHPVTRDLIWKCENTSKSLSLVYEFVNENYHEDYTISFYDIITGNTLEVANPVKEIINEITAIVGFISSTEHTFVQFVGINSYSKSYVVGMEFTCGRIDIPSFYRCENGKLINIQI